MVTVHHSFLLYKYNPLRLEAELKARTRSTSLSDSRREEDEDLLDPYQPVYILSEDPTLVPFELLGPSQTEKDALLYTEDPLDPFSFPVLTGPSLLSEVLFDTDPRQSSGSPYFEPTPSTETTATQHFAFSTPSLLNWNNLDHVWSRTPKETS